MERRLRYRVALHPPLQVLEALAERGHEAAAVHGVGVVEHNVQLDHHCGSWRISGPFYGGRRAVLFWFFFWQGPIYFPSRQIFSCPCMVEPNRDDISSGMVAVRPPRNFHDDSERYSALYCFPFHLDQESLPPAFQVLCYIFCRVRCGG